MVLFSPNFKNADYEVKCECDGNFMRREGKGTLLLLMAY